MPHLESATLLATDGLVVRRVECDGEDDVRQTDEHVGDARIIVVARGRFAFQDAAGRGIASPAAALCLADGHRYRVRHIEGGDVCIAFQGVLPRTIVEAGPTLRPVSVASFVKVRDLAVGLARGTAISRLAVEETVASALTEPDQPTRRAQGRARTVASAIAYAVEHGVDARLRLPALAHAAGVSVFHASRLFKQATGLTIHRYQQEIRLRHALACVLDTDRSIAEIAVACGFANQGHLTNAFTRRFKVTPARARKHGLQDSVRRAGPSV